MISWMGKALVKHGYTAPKFHAISHPRVCEPEAFTLADCLRRAGGSADS